MAFGNNESLRGVIIPEVVAQIGNHAFHRCTSLQDIVVPVNVV